MLLLLLLLLFLLLLVVVAMVVVVVVGDVFFLWLTSSRAGRWLVVGCWVLAGVVVVVAVA